jgi:hydrogenase nickel incorporation protein HypA/HybF
MHEYSLARALLEHVHAQQVRQSARRVAAVKVTVGEFAGVDAELLELAFRDLAIGTPAEGADVSISRVPLEARCQKCGHEFEIQRFRFVCPNCSTADVRIIRGEELMLESVTLMAEVENTAHVSA